MGCKTGIMQLILFRQPKSQLCCRTLAYVGPNALLNALYVYWDQMYCGMTGIGSKFTEMSKSHMINHLRLSWEAI